jgi:hypothetical protein
MRPILRFIAGALVSVAFAQAQTYPHICAGMRGKTGHQQPAKALKNQHRVQL